MPRGSSAALEAPRDRRFALIALTAFSYLAAGILVLAAADSTYTVARVVWPASGVGLAALLLGGRALWPGVALGAGLCTALTGGSLPFVVGTTVGNGLEAWFAAALLNRWGFHRSFDRPADVSRFALAAAAGAFVSAVWGVAAMLAGEGLPAAAAPRVVGLWSASHAMGVIVVAPLLLTVGDLREWLSTRARAAELAGLLLTLGALGVTAFFADSRVPLSYLPFPILIWAAVRFGPLGAAAANMMLSAIAMRWSAFESAGSPSAALHHVETWTYSTVTAVTTLFLGALVARSRRAEEERSRSERDYRLLIEQAADGVVIFNSDGVCIDANTSVCQMVGRRFNQMLGLRAADLVLEQHAARVERHLRGLRPGKAGVYSWRLQRRDGSGFPAEVSAKRFEDGRVQAFIRDDTRRKSLEEQLLQAQKMDAVGQLAGGVAHEFNNILTLILGHAFSLRSTVQSGTRAEDRVLRIVDAAERAGKITRRLLTFARKEPAEPRVVDLNDLLSELDDVLPRLLGEDIQFITVLSSEPWKVSVDPGLLQQVLLNVALNARDAMPQGGRLVIECRNTHLQGTKAGSLPPGDYAQLVITDTGTGMDSSVRARVFEPFFTTKNRNEGAGLGLAVSYGIIKQAGGEIRIRSEVDEGATVEVYLPRVRGSSEDEKPAARNVAQPARGESVLLIEDEEGVRDLALDALSQAGYDVWVAADGEEAVRISKRRADEPIHLVVSDVVLPGVSGTEAVRAIRRNRPGVPVLFISGYPEQRTASDELRTVGTGFLAKPFAPPELIAAVRAMLDGEIDRDLEAS